MSETALSKSIDLAQQIYEFYRAYLPNVGRFDDEDSFLKSIIVVMQKGRYIVCTTHEGALLGFVETYRLNAAQVEHMCERAIFEKNNLESPFYKPFDPVKENITDGDTCWVENVAVAYEQRTPFRLGPIQRSLLKRYWKQNRDAKVHMGHASRKLPGLIKILQGGRHGRRADKD